MGNYHVRSCSGGGSGDALAYRNSLQLSLWSKEEVKWLLARRLPDQQRHQRQPPQGSGIAQLALFA
jgi:hypothetical protein